jgi:F0F1-type ATP synthase membrane subunit b/b'
MEALIASLADLKVIIGAVTFLIGIVIWVYRLRLDTNVNSEAIKALKEDIEKKVEDNESQISNIKKEIDVNINNVKDDLHDKVEVLRLSIKEELKEIKDKDFERSKRVFEKLDEIGKDITNIKVDNANNVSKEDLSFYFGKKGRD